MFPLPYKFSHHEAFFLEKPDKSILMASYTFINPFWQMKSPFQLLILYARLIHTSLYKFKIILSDSNTLVDPFKLTITFQYQTLLPMEFSCCWESTLLNLDATFSSMNHSFSKSQIHSEGLISNKLLIDTQDFT